MMRYQIRLQRLLAGLGAPQAIYKQVVHTHAGCGGGWYRPPLQGDDFTAISKKMACSANTEKGGLWYDSTTPDLGGAALRGLTTAKLRKFSP